MSTRSLDRQNRILTESKRRERPTQPRNKSEADELRSRSEIRSGSACGKEYEQRGILLLTMDATEDKYSRELGTNELEPDELENELELKVLSLDSHTFKAHPRGSVRSVTSEEVRRLKATYTEKPLTPQASQKR